VDSGNARARIITTPSLKIRKTRKSRQRLTPR
jgi:hypothetical protein